MKKTIRILSTALALVMTLTGCAGAPVPSESNAPETVSSPLPDAVLDSCYEGQDDPAFQYFHNSSIQNFFAMWVKEKTGDLSDPQWDYDGFTKIEVLDQDLTVSSQEAPLYCLPFSDGGDRYGYVIAQYNAAAPSVSNWEVMETTPYLYDLRANREAIASSLIKTDIDLSTARASRVCLFDKDKNRTDQAVRFTDGKGDNYLCYFGGTSFEIKKWTASE